MIFAWLNDAECQVKESESGAVVLALRFDAEYVRWETQSWPDDWTTSDDDWYEVDLDDSDVRRRFQSDRERAVMFPAGPARDAAVYEYQGRLCRYRDEVKDLAVEAAKRRYRAALADRPSTGT
jgi:hypothetical protein